MGLKLNPLTGNFETTIDSSVLKIDTTNSRIGIGTQSPSTLLQIESTDPTLRMKRSDGSAYGEVTSDTSGLISFKSDPSNVANGSGFRFTVDNSEKVRLNDSGLLFNSDTAASNALNDYEEGTAFASATDITVSQAAYTKVGKMVTITFRISISNGSQTLNLPFAHAGGHGDHITGVVKVGSTFSELFNNGSTITLAQGFNKGFLIYPTNT